MTQAEEFYEIVAERHQRGSIIMTSNRPPGDWLSLFPDQVMAYLSMDRCSIPHSLNKVFANYFKLQPPEGIIAI